MHSTLFRAFAIVASLAGSSAAANAAMVISSAPTSNVTCAKATCTATAANAVLNVGRLQSMLGKENPKLVSGSVANDIVISAALTWVSSHTLTLDAYHSIIVNQPVTITGTGGLTLLTNDGGTGGTFSFGIGGNVGFWDLSSKLTINGNAYTLVNSIFGLGNAIGSDPTGHFALATSYDASADGTHSGSPLPLFGGTVEGLGNAISNLTIVDASRGDFVGLFREIDSGGTVENIDLIKANIQGKRKSQIVGSLAGFNKGFLFGDFASGSVVGVPPRGGSDTGGLVGENEGTISASHVSASGSGIGYVGGLAGTNDGLIENSFATGAVSGGGSVGGLVGVNEASIVNSFATGAVTGGDNSAAGGLVGGNYRILSNSYATGSVNVTGTSDGGGLVGVNSFTIADSYSTGSVSGDASSTIGGFVGFDGGTTGSMASAHWDTTTSGIANSSQGAGNISNDPGITGLTTVQLQAGLPTGFDPSIWAESSTINSGLPYLLDIPPT